MMYSIAPIYGLDQTVEYEQVEYNGFEVLACKTPEGYVLERLYSTNPKIFLEQICNQANYLKMPLSNKLVNDIIIDVCIKTHIYFLFIENKENK